MLANMLNNKTNCVAKDPRASRTAQSFQPQLLYEHSVINKMVVQAQSYNSDLDMVSLNTGVNEALPLIQIRPRMSVQVQCLYGCHMDLRPP